MKRKHISFKTRCASLIVQAGLVPYDDAKLMTEDQIISLCHVDHNILHETGHPDRDKFWNLTHMLIPAHREKTKRDAKIIAKGRRIRGEVITGIRSRPIQSRGFDKTLRRKMDGTVERRER